MHRRRCNFFLVRKILAPQLHTVSAALSLLCGTLAHRKSVLTSFIES
jgi:hypothetical protein